MTEHPPDLPPQDLEAERAVLGSAIARPELVLDLAPILTPGDFYAPSHGSIYEALLELAERGEPIDYLSVGAALRQRGDLEVVGGQDFLFALASGLALSHFAALHHARRVRDLARRRRLREAGRRIYELATETETVDEAERLAELELAHATEERGEDGPVPIGALIDAELEAGFARADQVGGEDGIRTGFASLDREQGRLRPGELVVVAARPAVGKTSLGLDIVRRVAARGERVLLFSLEMDGVRLARRKLVAEAGGDAGGWRDGAPLGEQARARYRAAALRLRNLPIVLDDSRETSLSRLRLRALREHRRAPLSLIVVDYLQLLSGSDRKASRHEQLAEVGRALRALAKDVACPLIALAQLNRETERREDKRPRLADLRESGAIEADADRVWALHRPALYDPQAPADAAQLIILKSRDGRTCEVALQWIGERTTFLDPLEARREGAA